MQKAGKVKDALILETEEVVVIEAVIEEEVEKEEVQAAAVVVQAVVEAIEVAEAEEDN